MTMGVVVYKTRISTIATSHTAVDEDLRCEINTYVRARRVGLWCSLDRVCSRISIERRREYQSNVVGDCSPNVRENPQHSNEKKKVRTGPSSISHDRDAIRKCRRRTCVLDSRVGIFEA